MAFQQPSAEQLDVTSIAQAMSEDTTSISLLATGLISDPSSELILSDTYVRKDGDNFPNALVTGQVLVLSGSPLSLENRFLVKNDISDADWISDITSESLGDLADVTLTGSPLPETSNVLMFNGVDWSHASLQASDIKSGTFDNARISLSSVSQHEASLSINESQISADYSQYFQATAPVDGHVLIGNSSPAWITRALLISDIASLDTALDSKLQWVSPPSSANDTGTAGQVAYGSEGSPLQWYFYVCVATNTWVRQELTTW